MKIVMLHPHDLFDSHEPWTIRIESIAREFIRMGHSVRVIHFIRDTSLEKYTIHPYGFHVVSLKRRGGWRFFRDNFREVLHEVRKADMVHFQKCFHYVSLPVLFGCCFFSKPVHYDWDDLEEAIYAASAHPPNWMIHFFLKTFEKMLPAMVDTVSVASKELKNMCLSCGVPSEKIFDAPVGADLAKFGDHVSGERMKKRFGNKKKLVLYLGQLNGAQYTRLFIQAVSELKEESPEARYLIIGSGSKFKALKRLAMRLGVGDDIQFIGAIRHEMVPQYLAAADITVACFEDNEITRCKSPLKVVEYLAAGKAIVASAVGEVKTMLEGSGILVTSGSSHALADGIRQLLKDESKIQELGLLARKKAEERYNWPRIAQNIMSAYQVALGVNGHHHTDVTALDESAQFQFFEEEKIM